MVTDLDVLAATLCVSPLTTAKAGLSQVKLKSISAAKTLRNGISLCPPGAIVKGPYFANQAPKNLEVGFGSTTVGRRGIVTRDQTSTVRNSRPNFRQGPCRCFFSRHIGSGCAIWHASMSQMFLALFGGYVFDILQTFRAERGFRYIFPPAPHQSQQPPRKTS